jgi:hypothetical protein
MQEIIYPIVVSNIWKHQLQFKQQTRMLWTNATQAQLLAIRPTDLKRWMCLKVHGDLDPPADVNPTEGISSALECYKKAMSYFMPNRLTAWNVESSSGNPTHSIEVNKLIKNVKKKEVCKQGKESNTKQWLEAGEFEQTLEILKQSRGMKTKFMMTTANKFQRVMVATIDDKLPASRRLTSSQIQALTSLSWQN